MCITYTTRRECLSTIAGPLGEDVSLQATVMRCPFIVGLLTEENEMDMHFCVFLMCCYDITREKKEMQQPTLGKYMHCMKSKHKFS